MKPVGTGLKTMIRNILSSSLTFLLISCASTTTEQNASEAPTKLKPVPTPKLIDGKYKIVKTQRGKMSWYSVKTNFGTATASGEKFADHKPTAAHKKLKMGTMVRVTNLNNGRSKILRINDRGPYKPGRIIDVPVGMARATHLDFYQRGVVPCKVEVLEEFISPAPLEPST